LARRLRCMLKALFMAGVDTMAAKISGWGNGMEDLSPSVPEQTKRIVAPAATAIFPFRILPTRILGPWRSYRMPIGRPT
jgi:hypothetical protein